MKQTRRAWIITTLLASGFLVGLASQSRALEIEIDYRYDLEGFFSAEGNPQGADGAAAARAAIEAAADRLGAIIDQPLLAAEFNDDRDDVRIRFLHPSTGKSHEVSPAASAASDALAANAQVRANEYRGSWKIAADTYVIYVGAYLFGGDGDSVHRLSSASTGFGENFVEVLNNPNSPIFRGFPHPFPNGPRDNLPTWGGSISFTSDPDIDWHFNHLKIAPANTADLYSVALHEIGHCLGQNTREWNNWRGYIAGFEFRGPETLKAAAAIGAPVPEINDGLDAHWFEGTTDSHIFPNGKPNYLGTVGLGKLQSSVMQGVLEFSAEVSRYEITNLDAASLRDIGWSTISGEVPDNRPPVAEDASTTTPENTPVGELIANIKASDPDVGDTLSYAITSGNIGGAFAIDNNGNISSATSLDFESNASYTLTVTVTDSGSLTDTATASIEITNINEPPSTTLTAATVIPENTAVGEIVATVSASDPDAGDTLSYSISSGNTGGAFAIDADGNISVAAPLDDEQTADFSLDVTVTDSGSLSIITNVSISITNVPDPVDPTGIEFSINLNFRTGNAPAISWVAPAGTRFRILTSTNLRDWLPVTPDIIADGEATTWEDGQDGFNDPNPPASETAQKYYRLVINPESGEGGVNPAERNAR